MFTSDRIMTRREVSVRRQSCWCAHQRVSLQSCLQPKLSLPTRVPSPAAASGGGSSVLTPRVTQQDTWAFAWSSWRYTWQWAGGRWGHWGPGWHDVSKGHPCDRARSPASRPPGRAPVSPQDLLQTCLPHGSCHVKTPPFMCSFLCTFPTSDKEAPLGCCWLCTPRAAELESGGRRGEASS